MTDRLTLLLLAAGCLLFGAIIFVELDPARVDEGDIARIAARPEIAPAGDRQQSPSRDELVATILARPLFSSTRRPPQNASAGDADVDIADARLTGIITEPGRRIAIFAVKGDKPLRVAEGDDVKGWRIESITPREVSLSGPSGTKTLQPKLDPNLAPPGQQAAGGSPPARSPVPLAAAAARGRNPAAAAMSPSEAVLTNPPGVPPRRVRDRQQR